MDLRSLIYRLEQRSSYYYEKGVQARKNGSPTIAEYYFGMSEGLDEAVVEVQETRERGE